MDLPSHNSVVKPEPVPQEPALSEAEGDGTVVARHGSAGSVKVKTTESRMGRHRQAAEKRDEGNSVEIHGVSKNNSSVGRANFSGAFQRLREQTYNQHHAPF
jgi:hypothetical protein